MGHLLLMFLCFWCQISISFCRFVSVDCLLRLGRKILVLKQFTCYTEKSIIKCWFMIWPQYMYMLNTLMSNYLFKICCMSVLIAYIVLTLQLLFMVGTLIISMAMQLDRRGLWSCHLCFGHYGHFLGEFDFSITPKH